MKLVIQTLAALLFSAPAWAQTTTLSCTPVSRVPAQAPTYELVLNQSAKTVTIRANMDGKLQVNTFPAVYTLISVEWKESGYGVTETNILNPMNGVQRTTASNGKSFTDQCKPAAK
jgi:hypothetical protein